MKDGDWMQGTGCGRDIGALVAVEMEMEMEALAERSVYCTARVRSSGQMGISGY
jgi:hypothetical protein